MAQTMKAVVVEKPKKMALKQGPEGLPKSYDEVLDRGEVHGDLGTTGSIYTGQYRRTSSPSSRGTSFRGGSRRRGGTRGA